MFNQFYKCKEALSKQYQINNFKNGISAEELKIEVRKIINSEPDRPTAKARAIAFTLRNAGIEYTEGELFADKINHADIFAAILTEWKAQRRSDPECAPKEPMQEYAAKNQIYLADMDFGHISPDWDYVMKRGFVGILDDLRALRGVCGDGEKIKFYNNSITVYEAIIDYIKRYRDLCLEHGTPLASFVAKNLDSLANGAPKTLPEAMQLTLIYYTLQHNLDCVFVRTLGGIDHLYYPYYKNDVGSGRFTEFEIRTMCADFLWKCHAMKACANLPFYLGGRDEAGNDMANDFTLVLLEEYRKLDIHDPKIHVMWHAGLRDDVIDYILDTIRDGKSSFVFINTAVTAKALMNIGISERDANRATVYGCYEPAAEGTEIPSTCAGHINVVKAMELALCRGIDPTTNEKFGIDVGNDFTTFDELFDAVGREFDYLAESCMDIISGYERHYERVCPSPIISATFENSRNNGRDLYVGGAKYNNTSIVCAGIATLADSMYAIKKAVYDERLVSLEQMKKCLADNFKGYDNLRFFCKFKVEKFGNNCPAVDAIAAKLTERMARAINGKKNGRGGVFRLGMFSIDWRFKMGEYTRATADGRLAGEPLSKNTAPSIGADKNGVTSYLRSVLAIDASLIPDGSVADVTLHSSAVAGDDGLSAMRGLLKTYMTLGGFGVHFNVLDPDVLLAAQKEPDRYKNLQIRLCGWNVHFVDLNKYEQDEFILKSRGGI